MQVEIGEEDARNPTGEFVVRGELKGNQCWKRTCKCCGGVFIGKQRKLAMHIAGEKFAAESSINVLTCHP